MRARIRSLLPASVVAALRVRRRQFAERRFRSQALTTISCGEFTLEAPLSHLLTRLQRTQPYRDLCVGITAKGLSAKYPHSTMIDVGANIGDTAAMMARHCGNKLVLIEASEYFFALLTRNTAQFPNEVVLRRALVSDGSEMFGSLRHWGGTAYFESDGSAPGVTSVRLSDIADDQTCFVKIDTDGHDVRILNDSLDWLASARAAVLFENQIGSREDCDRVDELFHRLRRIGYEYFIVWDDPGFHVISTRSIDVLHNLNRYLLRVTQSADHVGISNFDVLCLHENDHDVLQHIDDWYRTH